jgi:hypothetical protein
MIASREYFQHSLIDSYVREFYLYCLMFASLDIIFSVTRCTRPEFWSGPLGLLTDTTVKECVHTLASHAYSLSRSSILFLHCQLRVQRQHQVFW